MPGFKVISISPNAIILLHHPTLNYNCTPYVVIVQSAAHPRAVSIVGLMAGHSGSSAVRGQVIIMKNTYLLTVLSPS
jgi:hypothetical protein